MTNVQAMIFGTATGFFASIISVFVSYYYQLKNIAIKKSMFLAEQKYKVYSTYMMTVNKAWAQHKVGRKVSRDLIDKGIDSYEEMRILSTPDVQAAADMLNQYFWTCAVKILLRKSSSYFEFDFFFLKPLQVLTIPF